jgi:hypothetical protein
VPEVDFSFADISDNLGYDGPVTAANFSKAAVNPEKTISLPAVALQMCRREMP